MGVTQNLEHGGIGVTLTGVSLISKCGGWNKEVSSGLWNERLTVCKYFILLQVQKKQKCYEQKICQKLNIMVIKTKNFDHIVIVDELTRKITWSVLLGVTCVHIVDFICTVYTKNRSRMLPANEKLAWITPCFRCTILPPITSITPPWSHIFCRRGLPLLWKFKEFPQPLFGPRSSTSDWDYVKCKNNYQII